MSPTTAQQTFDKNIATGMSPEEARSKMVEALGAYWKNKFDAMEANFKLIADQMAEQNEKIKIQDEKIEILNQRLDEKGTILHSATVSQNEMEMSLREAKKEVEEANRRLEESIVLVDQLRAFMSGNSGL